MSRGHYTLGQISIMQASSKHIVCASCSLHKSIHSRTACTTHSFQAAAVSAPCVRRKAAPVQLWLNSRVACRQYRLQNLTVTLNEARAQARMPIRDGSQRVLRRTGQRLAAALRGAPMPQGAMDVSSARGNQA